MFQRIRLEINLFQSILTLVKLLVCNFEISPLEPIINERKHFHVGLVRTNARQNSCAVNCTLKSRKFSPLFLTTVIICHGLIETPGRTGFPYDCLFVKVELDSR